MVEQFGFAIILSSFVSIEAFTQVGEKVIVQTPVYPPFFHSVRHAKRKVLKNSLKQLEDGSYTFDIEDLKSKIDKDTKLLLLCSPHNPRNLLGEFRNSSSVHPPRRSYIAACRFSAGSPELRLV